MPSSLSCRVIFVTLAAACAESATGHAQPRSTDPLALVVSSDPLDLARAVDRLGDGAVLARLGAANDEELDPALVLAAIRAAPWLHAPEEALTRLVELAAGHDPDLAPAATLALVRIAERLTPADLDAREASREPVRASLAALSALADDATARTDIRRASARVRELLRALVE